MTPVARAANAAGLSHKDHLQLALIALSGCDLGIFIVNLFSWVPNLDTAKAVFPYNEI